ncbi:hypothetical protein CPJCM30710_28630 [Clostridium polyendosporum]|uniref:histidine kinase n=1 Tax=Clostridium polyendosporum TaxID=69208 RepID=A0A919VHF3_9CLOT|nr:PAS domain-containing sensor histidine kinase [Clostridium polyendosporum]GIM30197.1 hypothetical protein CPJCM30710_28630 [Clostridium polyendosporum]
MNDKKSNQKAILNLRGNLSKLPCEKSTALMIVIIYALISEFWILLSDKVLIKVLYEILHIPMEYITIALIAKGTTYVVISAILLYLFIYKNMLKIKNLKKDLKTSEERYRSLIKLLPDAVTIIKNDKYIFTNDAGAKLFEFDKSKQIFKNPIKNLIRPNYSKLLKAQINSTENNQGKFPLIEEKLIRNDGTVIDVEIRSCKFNYDGQPSILSVIRDITERKKIENILKKALEENKSLLEKMIELDKVKTEFFANISHEFKTPLNIIFGVVQLLSNSINDSEIKITPAKLNDYTALMRQNCYRLLRLINNLIDITKADSDFLEMNYKNYNIITLIENISLSVAEYAKNKGLSLIFDTEVEEKFMACDADKIERVILNLLSNSIKFTKRGGTIYVNIYDYEDSITISVKDTGIGIPKNKIDKIFDRFIQVDSSLHRENEGSGIGLSLVKSLVEKHGGQISVTSTENLGTEFFIKLPVKILPGESEKLLPNNSNHTLVEKIQIELSDIYSIY